MNITEDYVSFETAKLLKKKGFNWEWSPFYSEQDRDKWARNNNYNIPNPNYDANIPFDSEILNVIAPHVSLQMAMKWLREKHSLHIQVFYDMEKSAFWASIIPTMYPISDKIEQNTLSFDYKGITYEEACEAAIKYCLENLI